MSNHSSIHHKRRLSLSLRISGLFILASVLPLFLTVSFIEVFSRPTMIAQTSQEMETDARARTQLIDNYFAERILEAEALSRLQPIQNFLAGNVSFKARAFDGLATAHGRGSHYEDWSLFDLQGNLRLFYPTRPQLHGQFYILPVDQHQLLTSKRSLISDVFFNAISNEAYIDIYTPVVTSSYSLVGILRTSFDLQYIWNIVDSEAGANGPGSYAILLDHNGVRIAYTNPHPDPTGMTDSPYLLKAITPISPETQQLFNYEGIYGMNATGKMPILPDHTLDTIQQNNNPPTTFQMQPTEQKDTFEVALSKTYIVPWTYYALSPLRTVTSVADQQLFITLIITFVVVLFAAVIGLLVGQDITRPILRSVNFLHSSSQLLKTLATREQSAAEEQRWVVEASQLGFQKVQYYNKATSIAAQQLNEIGSKLLLDWHRLNAMQVKQSLVQIIEAARYIEKVGVYQDESDKNLAAAIRVTTQVSEHLSSGAASAADAVRQLETVVNQLEAVVGK